MYTMSLIRGGFIQTDLPWKSVVERKVRGSTPTILGFAANTNSMLENSLKLKKIIFCSVTTPLWAISENMDLTEGLCMCFFYFNFCTTSTFWTLSIRTMCASVDVFTLVATFLVAIYFHINSKVFPVLKPQPDKITDATKRKKKYCCISKSIGVCRKRKESGRTYSHAACPWVNCLYW